MVKHKNLVIFLVNTIGYIKVLTTLFIYGIALIVLL